MHWPFDSSHVLTHLDITHVVRSQFSGMLTHPIASCPPITISRDLKIEVESLSERFLTLLFELGRIKNFKKMKTRAWTEIRIEGGNGRCFEFNARLKVSFRATDEWISNSFNTDPVIEGIRLRIFEVLGSFDWDKSRGKESHSRVNDVMDDLF